MTNSKIVVTDYFDSFSEGLAVISPEGIQKIPNDLDSYAQISQKITTSLSDTRFCVDSCWDSGNIYCVNSKTGGVIKAKYDLTTLAETTLENPIAISVIQTLSPQGTMESESPHSIVEDQGCWVVDSGTKRAYRMDGSLNIMATIDGINDPVCIVSANDNGCYGADDSTQVVFRALADGTIIFIKSYAELSPSLASILEMKVDSENNLWVATSSLVYKLSETLSQITVVDPLGGFSSSDSSAGSIFADSIGAIDIYRGTDSLYIYGGDDTFGWIGLYDSDGVLINFNPYIDLPFPRIVSFPSFLKVPQNNNSECFYIGSSTNPDCQVWAHWKLNDNADNDYIEDSSGNARHCTLFDNSAPSITTNSVSSVYPNAKFFRAFKWDYDTEVDGEYISTTFGEGAFPFTDLTLSAWIKARSWGGPDGRTPYKGSGHGRILDDSILIGGSRTDGVEFYVEASSYGPSYADPSYWPTGRLKATFNGGVQLKVLSRPPSEGEPYLRINTWHQVTIVRTISDSKFKFYIDGQYANESVNYNNVYADIMTHGGIIHIGNRAGYDRSFDGWIDNVLIVDRALSDDEIMCLYNNSYGTETTSCLCPSNYQLHKFEQTTLNEITSISLPEMANARGMTVSHYACSLKSGSDEVAFTIEGMDGHTPQIEEPDIMIGIKKSVNVTSTGSNNRGNGEDVGKYDYRASIPSTPSSLPPGFTEVYRS